MVVLNVVFSQFQSQALAKPSAVSSCLTTGERRDGPEGVFHPKDPTSHVSIGPALGFLWAP